MSAAFLEVVDLRKRFGDTQALDGVGFTVKENEIFGLLGPNGAGKTTLLSIVAGLQTADAGAVLLLGKPFIPGDSDARRLIGVVPQDLALYGPLTARENLHFFGELYGLGGTDLRRRAQAILEAIGLEDRADDRAQTFSGGMKRRLNLGIALVHGPRLLLLDEPTAGVDPQSRNHIFEEVKRLNAAGLTVVYTSHYMEEVQALCTRVGIMDRGRLAACDTLANLLQQLRGLLRFRVSPLTAQFKDKLRTLPDTRLTADDGRALELACSDVKGTLIRLVSLLNEANVELLHLESEEPNLERVFLHLTGRALRD
jgi:ABC-2 type transport system ATP-binding protein